MATSSEHVKITSAGGTFDGYFAAPGGDGAAPGVVVIQEIFGVNSHIRSVVERLAGEGYAALAPDLFWRVRPGIELGYTPDDIAQGREIRGKLNDDEVVEDVRATFEVLGKRPECQGRKLGITGFCWGGFVTYLAACRLSPAATASYYGGGIAGFLDEADKIDAPILFHFGEKDARIPLSDVEQVKEKVAGKHDAQVFVYPEAEHGFHCDQRGSYQEAAARQAWARSMELFGKHLK
ncbi:MAG: dienelactone hydrolase family protein [SAR324 cluster bacterium]|nr:dienelactone hydrolase family protein [SAR324 cluster bacterium]